MTPNMLQEFLPSLVTIGGILLGLWLMTWLAGRAIRRLATRMSEGDRERMKEIEQWARHLTRFVRRSFGGIAVLVSGFLVLSGLGVGGVRKLTWERVTDWLFGPGLTVLLVLGGAWILNGVIRMVAAQLPGLFVLREGSPAERAERAKRAATLIRVLRLALSTMILSVAVLVSLRRLGMDITPILTGAGIGGLAFGFGAQNLVRDVISGFFLILENQVRVGDVVSVNGKSGLVEAVRLRTIVLRGLDGTVHTVPNGAINEVSNLTKDFSYYLADIGVAYKENVDRVMEVLTQVGAELQRDPAYAESILEPLEILGVDALADSAVVIKVRIKTVPLQQWKVGREMMHRIKKAFDTQGIEIPFPHLSVYFGEASKPFSVQVAEKMASA